MHIKNFTVIIKKNIFQPLKISHAVKATQKRLFAYKNKMKREKKNIDDHTLRNRTEQQATAHKIIFTNYGNKFVFDVVHLSIKTPVRTKKKKLK